MGGERERSPRPDKARERPSHGCRGSGNGKQDRVPLHPARPERGAEDDAPFSGIVPAPWTGVCFLQTQVILLTRCFVVLDEHTALIQREVEFEDVAITSQGVIVLGNCDTDFVQATQNDGGVKR